MSTEQPVRLGIFDWAVLGMFLCKLCDFVHFSWWYVFTPWYIALALALVGHALIWIGSRR